MTLNTRMDRASLLSNVTNLANWPTIDVTLLSEKDAARVAKRIEAVRAYLEERPVGIISKQTGLPRQELYRLVKRCMKLHHDGRIWGFRALLPGCHIKPYVRIAKIDGSRPPQHGGAAGALTMLFDRYPTIRQAVDALFLKKMKDHVVQESRMPVKVIHKCFIDKCKEVGLTAKHYPLNMNHRARRALSS